MKALLFYKVLCEVTVWAGENKVVLNAGESFLITPSTTHVVGALSDQPASWLIATTGTLDQAETPDMALIKRIATEIGDEILDPSGALPLTAAVRT